MTSKPEADNAPTITSTPVLPPQSLNEWFLSLPPERRAVLRGDKWMLAEAAFLAGRLSAASATEIVAEQPRHIVVDFKYGNDPVESKVFDYATQQSEAEAFCKRVRERGGAVNVAHQNEKDGAHG
jgi:hypothetical protein|nr:hypothetical protein [Neorhizobium tomejilense]